MGETKMVKRDCMNGEDRNSPFSNKCIPTGTVVPAATNLRVTLSLHVFYFYCFSL